MSRAKFQGLIIPYDFEFYPTGLVPVVCKLNKEALKVLTLTPLPAPRSTNAGRGVGGKILLF